MALAAIGYAKAMHRRRMMACTTSIGPGATNMITAAAVAHVDRLPVLLLPGDVFASRRPDPVLQQVESFGDGTVSANDCFRPVSRYFDRITRPEQILTALPRALSVLTDPAECGPVTLALCQDVQAEAFDYPEQFFATACSGTSAGSRPDAGRTGGGGGSAARRQGAADHRRRRRALFRGDRGARPLRHRARHPGGGDPGGQERAAARSSLQSRRDRRHRHIGGEPGRGGSRCHPRGRHAAAGFHHGIVGAVPKPRAPADRPQRAGVRRRQASHAAADRRCTRWADGAGHRARRPPRAGCLAAAPDRRRRLRGASRPPPSPRRPTPNCRRTRR